MFVVLKYSWQFSGMHNITTQLEAFVGGSHFCQFVVTSPFFFLLFYSTIYRRIHKQHKYVGKNKSTVKYWANKIKNVTIHQLRIHQHCVQRSWSFLIIIICCCCSFFLRYFVNNLILFHLNLQTSESKKMLYNNIILWAVWCMHFIRLCQKFNYSWYLIQF